MATFSRALATKWKGGSQGAAPPRLQKQIFDNVARKMAAVEAHVQEISDMFSCGQRGCVTLVLLPGSLAQFWPLGSGEKFSKLTIWGKTGQILPKFPHIDPHMTLTFEPKVILTCMFWKPCHSTICVYTLGYQPYFTTKIYCMTQGECKKAPKKPIFPNNVSGKGLNNWGQFLVLMQKWHKTKGEI